MEVDGRTSQIIIQLVILVILTLVNAFFSGAEMAFVSVNKVKMHQLMEEGNKKAKLVTVILQDSTKLLSTIQVAITFAGFFSSASAATGISQILGRWLEIKGIPFASTISFVAITLILMYFNLVFGELVPKRMALQRAESFCLFAAKPVRVVSIVVAPFIKLLSLSTNAILSIFKMNKSSLEAEVSEEEIKALLETGSAMGVFNQSETDMIKSIFSFDDKVAKEVMVPRKDIFAVDINKPFLEYIDELLEVKHSRVPVYEDTIDNIIGILNLKDIASKAREIDYEDMDVRALLHDPYFVYSTKKTDELFKGMQEENQHMAILVDEYGGTVGIVTIEDLVEEIVGELRDEYDEEEEEEIISQGDNTYVVDGTTSLEDVNDELNLNLTSDNYDTLSGFIVEQLDYIPTEGETPRVTLQDISLDVLKVEGKAIAKVLITIQRKTKKEV